MVLTVCLTIDTECSFWKYIPSPHMNKFGRVLWRLNNMRGQIYRYARNRRGLVNIVNILKQFNIPATFTIIGHLYLKECKGHPHFSEQEPKNKWLGKSWYYWDPASNHREYPGLYVGDFIEGEMRDVPYFDLGLHAFAHEAYAVESADFISNSLDAGIAAAKKLDIKLTSYSGPWNMIEDIKEPDKILANLKEKGFTTVRFVGVENGFKNYHKNKITQIKRKYSLTTVHVSAYFEGTSQRSHIDKILGEIRNNTHSNNVYCLCSHDYTHRSTHNFSYIIRELANLRSNGLIKIKNMRELG